MSLLLMTDPRLLGPYLGCLPPELRHIIYEYCDETAKFKTRTAPDWQGSRFIIEVNKGTQIGLLLTNHRTHRDYIDHFDKKGISATLRVHGEPTITLRPLLPHFFRQHLRYVKIVITFSSLRYRRDPWPGLQKLARMLTTKVQHVDGSRTTPDVITMTFVLCSHREVHGMYGMYNNVTGSFAPWNDPDTFVTPALPHLGVGKSLQLRHRATGYRVEEWTKSDLVTGQLHCRFDLYRLCSYVYCKDGHKAQPLNKYEVEETFWGRSWLNDTDRLPSRSVNHQQGRASSNPWIQNQPGIKKWREEHV